MSVKTYQAEILKEKIINNLEDKMSENKTEMDPQKLAGLKALLAHNEENKMPAKIVAKKTRSVEFGVVGSGQGGTNLCASFFQLGYAALAINTAEQDLKHLPMPEDNKLLLNYTIGGSAKDRSVGNQAVLANRQEVVNLVNEKLKDSQINIFCTSLGGGSGSGSIEALVDVLLETGKPLMMIAILPMSSEDMQTKSNALEALAEVAKLVQSKKVSNLILVDNSKIETIYQNVNQMDFFDTANKAIVEPLDAINCLSSMSSKLKALDSLEYVKILLADGLSTYGMIEISSFEEETAIAEALLLNLSKSLLADLDIKQAKFVGYTVSANANTWKKIPASAVNYANEIIQEQAGLPQGVFKGIYTVEEMPDDLVRVYTIISGTGLPMERATSLKKEVETMSKTMKQKDNSRDLNLTLESPQEAVSVADKIKNKVAAKTSQLNKFVGVVDRRKQ